MSDSKFESLLVFLGVLFVPIIIGAACYAVELNDTAAYERLVTSGVPAQLAECVDKNSESYVESDECLRNLLRKYAEEHYSCKLVPKD